jgi:tripartite-type tricarboxylate transporter receptor subunit TctC
MCESDSRSTRGCSPGGPLSRTTAPCSRRPRGIASGLLAAAVAAAAIAATGFSAVAQTYPSHPLTLIVPFPPGGGVDAIARIVAEKLGSGLGQQVIIDNRGGAAGLIGMRLAARAAPDGYTIAMTHTGITSINPTLYAKPGYDARRDFVPIGLIATTPIVLMTNAAFPARSVKDVIAMARREPLNVGAPPPGTGSYLAAELFKAAAGIDFTIVTYKGTGPLTNDLLGGHVPIAFNVLAPAMGNIQAGTLRAIATAGPARLSLLPEVPTVAESGLAGFEAVLHYGMMAPAGTPADIIARLNRALRAALDESDVKSRIYADGGDPLSSSPQGYAADIAREEPKWSALIKKLGIKLQ